MTAVKYANLLIFLICRGYSFFYFIVFYTSFASCELAGSQYFEDSACARASRRTGGKALGLKSANGTIAWRAVPNTYEVVASSHISAFRFQSEHFVPGYSPLARLAVVPSRHITPNVGRTLIDPRIIKGMLFLHLLEFGFTHAVIMRIAPHGMGLPGTVISRSQRGYGVHVPTTVQLIDAPDAEIERPREGSCWAISIRQDSCFCIHRETLLKKSLGRNGIRPKVSDQLFVRLDII